jgi:hypothetical protein
VTASGESHGDVRPLGDVYEQRLPRELRLKEQPQVEQRVSREVQREIEERE